MALRGITWAFALPLLLASTAAAQHPIVPSGESAGGYAAFPDVGRLRNGDLYCVFYSGYGHVSTPNDKTTASTPDLQLCSISELNGKERTSRDQPRRQSYSSLLAVD